MQHVIPDASVLLLSCGGAAGLTAMSHIRATLPGLKLVGADLDPYSAAEVVCDDFVQLAAVELEDRVIELEGLLQDLSIDAIIGCHSTDLQVLAQLASKLALHEVSWYRPAKEPERLIDKLQTYAALDEVGVPVPYVEHESSGSRPYRRLLKPRFGGGGRGIISVEANEIAPVVDRSFLGQKFVDAKMELSLDGIVLKSGQVFGPVVRQRLKVRAGLAVVSQTVPNIDRGVSGLFEVVADSLGSRGPLNVQVLVDRDDRPFVIDVNPRFPAGGLALTRAAGLDISSRAVADLLGLDQFAASPFSGGNESLRQYRFFDDLVVKVEG